MSMEKKALENIRNSLVRRKANLLEWLNDVRIRELVLPSGGSGLSEVAKETDLEVLDKIDCAINKIDHGTFGQCKVCHEDVEPERLVLDFTSEICLTHYSSDELSELEKDLELAAKVQKHLLPGEIPDIPNINMAVLAKPARIVSGDYYDFFPFREHLQGFAIADVMGKGVPASMLMANLQASLRILGPEMHNLDDLAVRLNSLFRYNLKLIRFITLFLGGIDVKNGTLYYCNAGHNPPMLWKTAGNTVQWLNPTGPAIGLVPEGMFRSNSVSLDTGDMIVLYTDGLVEARNTSNDEFTKERLAGFMMEHHADTAEVFLNGLTRTLNAFTQDVHDDLTIMVLKMV